MMTTLHSILLWWDGLFRHKLNNNNNHRRSRSLLPVVDRTSTNSTNDQGSVPAAHAVVNTLGYTPLERASFHGQVATVQQLLEQYTLQQHQQQQLSQPQHWLQLQLDRPNIYGRTALRSACCQGHVEVVELLLRYGATVHYRDNGGATPLQHACHYGHAAIVHLLLQYGAADMDTDTTRHDDDDDWQEDWQLACRHGHVQVVQELLTYQQQQRRAATTTTTVAADHHQALWEAAAHGHDAIVALLLTTVPESCHVHRLSSHDHHNMTVLANSCWAGHTSVVAILLQTGGAAPNQRDTVGRTALHYCLSTSTSTTTPQKWTRHTVQMVQLLLDAGADTTIPDPVQSAQQQQQQQQQPVLPLDIVCADQDWSGSEHAKEDELVQLELIQLLLRKGLGDGTIQFKQ